MSFNIIEEVNAALASGMLEKTVSFLGEKKKNVNNAVVVIVPLLTAGFVKKAATSSNGTAKELFAFVQLVYEKNYPASINNIFSDGGSTLNVGAAVLQYLFGDRSGEIIGVISSYADIEKSSAGTLCSLAALISAGITGKQLTVNNYTTDEMVAELIRQEKNERYILASEFRGLLQSLRIKMPVAVSNHAIEPKTPGKQYQPGKKKPRKPQSGLWVIIITSILLIALAIAVWYIAV